MENCIIIIPTLSVIKSFSFVNLLLNYFEKKLFDSNSCFYFFEMADSESEAKNLSAGHPKLLQVIKNLI